MSLSVLRQPEPFWNKQLSSRPFDEGSSMAMSMPKIIQLVGWSRGPKPFFTPSPFIICTTGLAGSQFCYLKPHQNPAADTVARTMSKEESMEEKVTFWAAPTFQRKVEKEIKEERSRGVRTL